MKNLTGDSANGLRIDRRTAIKWIATAAAALPLINLRAAAAPGPHPSGYGMNPDRERIYKPGELWPLTFSPAQRVTVAALCDMIIPADSESPSASAVGVPDFIDEWISAPYGDGKYSRIEQFSFATDRAQILEGIEWLEHESAARSGCDFAHSTYAQKRQICADICYLPEAKPELQQAAKFFARFRDLTAGGFYTTPQGMKDLRYVGNIPLSAFDGPPLEVLKKVGLA